MLGGFPVDSLSPAPLNGGSFLLNQRPVLGKPISLSQQVPGAELQEIPDMPNGYSAVLTESILPIPQVFPVRISGGQVT
jgi:hypothetical protein